MIKIAEMTATTTEGGAILLKFSGQLIAVIPESTDLIAKVFKNSGNNMYYVQMENRDGEVYSSNVCKIQIIYK
jgi:hypothetical protein